MLVQHPMMAAVGIDLFLVNCVDHLASKEFRPRVLFHNSSAQSRRRLALPVVFRKTPKEAIMKDAGFSIGLLELFPGHLTNLGRSGGVALGVVRLRYWSNDFGLFLHWHSHLRLAGIEQMYSHP